MHETFAVYKEHPVGVVLGLLQHSSYNYIYALHLWLHCVGTILFADYMSILKAEFQTSNSGMDYYSLIEGCENKTLLVLFQILIWLQIELSDSFHYFASNLSVCRLSRAALLAIQKCIFFDSFISKWSDKAVRILRN